MKPLPPAAPPAAAPPAAAPPAAAPPAPQLMCSLAQHQPFFLKWSCLGERLWLQLSWLNLCFTGFVLKVRPNSTVQDDIVYLEISWNSSLGGTRTLLNAWKKSDSPLVGPALAGCKWNCTSGQIYKKYWFRRDARKKHPKISSFQ